MTENKQMPQQPSSTELTVPEVIDKLNPDKVEKIVAAFVTPFQHAGQQARREILWFTGGMMLLILAALFTLAVMRITDASNVVLALGTALGYVFGFLSRFLIRD